MDFQQKNAEVLGASFDDEEDNARFARKFSFPFPLLCDTERSVGMAYGACSSPDAEKADRISYLIGPDGRIRAAYSKVSPPTHPAEVLQELEGSGGRPTVAL